MKKLIALALAFCTGSFIYSQNKTTVQVLVPESINLSASDSAWLPGQIQDKFKSNMQEYLGMNTVVDSKSEEAVKKLQAQAEDSGRDEASAIELGKLTTAKFALFSKIRSTAGGYTISADFTDLTTGVQKASVSSKEYLQLTSLYGTTGAVDEITLKLAEKLGIKLSDLNKNLLSTGSSSFSLDEQLELAKQNEAQFQKMMADYDADLARLSTSNDINAVQNKKKLEAEKALLTEKQNAEKKRQQDLKVQKERAEADAKLETERSIALKTQRDNLAKLAAAKAAEVRKVKIEKQGVLGFITTLESKKKALVEIRQDVEKRSVELHNQMKKDEVKQTLKILEANWTTVELKDGNPTEAAKQRRANKVWLNNDSLLAKFYADCESVKQSTMAQQSALVADINADYTSLAKVKTVSSMGDELKVSYGTYDGDKYGWNAYLSLYSDGILLFSGTFIVKYEALAGKTAPDMETATDAQIDEYANNVDMYNSLLVRGDPVLYFELDYNAVAAEEAKPSTYTFNFTKVRAINTVSGKVVQTSVLNEKLVREMKPEQDLREIKGVVAGEEENSEIAKKSLDEGFTKIDVDFLKNLKEKGFSQADLERAKILMKEGFNFALILSDSVVRKILFSMVKIPGKDFEMLKTEVTQEMYEAVMGKNPSYHKGNPDLPVENISVLDVVRFCNEFSVRVGLEKCYEILEDERTIKRNRNASGFRLPTDDEWDYAQEGGEKNFSISRINSETWEKLGWFEENSGGKTHLVAQKKPNGYGLYDMFGNVAEFYNDDYYSMDSRSTWGGGSFLDVKYDNRCYYATSINQEMSYVGFRIVRTVSKGK